MDRTFKNGMSKDAGSPINIIAKSVGLIRNASNRYTVPSVRNVYKEMYACTYVSKLHPFFL